MPEPGQRAQGVITEVLGEPGEKDVDLRSVIVQFNLPGSFSEEVKAQAREALDTFNPDEERALREIRAAGAAVARSGEIVGNARLVRR